MIYKSEKGMELIQKHYETVIKEYSYRLETININTSFGNTFVLARGNKNNKVIILLHGSSTNSAMWLVDMEKLSINHRVYAIDILGEPGKSDAVRLDMTDNSHALWLDEVINKLNIDKVIMIGNSLGGWMALKYAVNYPEKVDRLMLLATSGIVNAKISFMFKVILFMIFGRKGIGKLNKIVYGREDIPEKVLEFSNLIMENYKPRTGSLPVFRDCELLRLNMPVLFIGGEDDALISSVKTSERLKKVLPDSKTLVLKDTGHVLINMIDEMLTFIKD